MKKIWLKKETKYQRGRGGWLNKYEFAHAGWDTVNTFLNTLKTIVAGLVQNATNQVHKKAWKVLAQVISQGRKEVERVIKELYKKKDNQIIV